MVKEVGCGVDRPGSPATAQTTKAIHRGTPTEGAKRRREEPWCESRWSTTPRTRSHASCAH